MKPVRLSKAVRDQLLDAISPTYHQAYRLINYLADNPRSVTVDVNRACAIGNISHVAHKINQRLLWKHGLFIGCERPASPVPNRFDEPSQMFLWSILAKTEAANDSDIVEELHESSL